MTRTVQTKTNSVARKRGTSAIIAAKTNRCSRSPKSSRASGAGGHLGDASHTPAAASEVAPRGASGQCTIDTQTMSATRKVSRTAASNASKPNRNPPQSALKPRAIETPKPRCCSRAAPHSVDHTPDGTHGLPVDATSIPDAVAAVIATPNCEPPPRQEPQASLPMPDEHREIIGSIRDNWRERQGIIKAMTKLSLQAQAMLRGGRDRDEAAKYFSAVRKDVSHKDYPTIAPYLEAQEPLARYRNDYEKTLVQQVKKLPIYEWAKGISGLGDPSLAGIIGECSGYNMETDELWSIGQMKSVSAMWKRLGLAVMGGVRQGDATAGLSKNDWVEHGYVKTRRSVVWNVGECIIKAQWRKENTVHAYGKFYGEEKARLQALNETGEYAEQAARIVERMKKAGSKPLTENLAGRLTPVHINNRAKRHMTKRLIRDLFIEWRRLDREALGLLPDSYAPLAEAA